MTTPLQTLLDERRHEFDEKVSTGELCWNGHKDNPLSDERIQTFIKESILQGVRLGLAMGRECVLEEIETPDGSEFTLRGFDATVGYNDCRIETIAALEAKEKELGV